MFFQLSPIAENLYPQIEDITITNIKSSLPKGEIQPEEWIILPTSKGPAGQDFPPLIKPLFSQKLRENALTNNSKDFDRIYTDIAQGIIDRIAIPANGQWHLNLSDFLASFSERIANSQPGVKNALLKNPVLMRNITLQAFSLYEYSASPPSIESVKNIYQAQTSIKKIKGEINQEQPFHTYWYNFQKGKLSYQEATELIGFIDKNHEIYDEFMANPFLKPRYSYYKEYAATEAPSLGTKTPFNNNVVQRKLDLLYKEMALDIKSGKPMVIDTTLLLWDASFGTEGYKSDGTKERWANGEDPTHNLYWGYGRGLYTLLKQSPDWKEVFQEKNPPNGAALRVVFRKTVPPNSFWESLGIKKTFDAYLAVNVFKASSSEKAYEGYAEKLFTEKNDPIRLKNGTTIDAGGKSRIVVMSGHLLPYEKTLSDYRAASSSIYKKGTGILTCLSAFALGGKSINENIVGLLYTQELFAPEGYAHIPFYNSITAGKNTNEIIEANNQEYIKEQKAAKGANAPVPKNMFTNEASFSPSFQFPY